MFKLHDQLLADRSAVHEIISRKNRDWESLKNSSHSVEKSLIVEIFMDPLSSGFWGFSPFIRRLEMQYSAELEIVYRTSGMLISWEDFRDKPISCPLDMAEHWVEQATKYRMPMNSSVWLEHPPHSSFPASIAYKAAQLQDKFLANAFLRRLQEMLFIEGRNIAKWKVIRKAAADSGLDIEVLLLQYNNGDGLKTFAEDQKRSRQEGVQEFPTIHVHNKKGQVRILEPEFNWRFLRNTIIDLLPKANLNLQKTLWTVQECFVKFESLTFSELQELTGLEGQILYSELNKAENKGVLGSFGCSSGRVWRSLN